MPGLGAIHLPGHLALQWGCVCAVLAVGAGLLGWDFVKAPTWGRAGPGTLRCLQKSKIDVTGRTKRS